jgi:hypothetical protein
MGACNCVSRLGGNGVQSVCRTNRLVLASNGVAGAAQRGETDKTDTNERCSLAVGRVEEF